ncbi:MAG: agmatine deiminase family protein [Saprospiraceae bacterium]|nr:agmatine deiminase family protein [Saprospiraceae bacterium]
MHFKYLLLALCFATLSAQAQTFTAPPPTDVRTMAEWEELSALVITWNPGFGGNAWRKTLSEIVKAARLECKVIIVCSSQSVINSAKNFLTAQGVDYSSNVEFLISPNDSIWVRDYGPPCIYGNGVDSLMLVDWIYNRTRYLDNAIPAKIGQYLHLPVYATTTAPYDLVNTGGNFMSDGMGTAFASKLIFRNNDQIANGEGVDTVDIFGTTNHTESSIDNIMAEFMGINRYIKMEELPYDGIHHIDMHMKLLDEETLLVGQFPLNTSDGPQIEANIQYVLSQFKTSFGRDFKVIRIPMPPYEGGQYAPFGGVNSLDALYPTYINAVFVNKTVIMPKYNIPEDGAAQDTFQKYLPGYEIVQVDCGSIIYNGGAVHCITKEIGVADPLLIQHAVLTCQDNSQTSGYEVSATIRHRSGISGAKVYYTTDLSASWTSIDMEHVFGDTAFLWSALIPPQAPGKTVYYYIEAQAENGKSITRPLPAPEAYWSFCVTQSSSTVEPLRVRLEDVYPNPASAMTVVPVHSNQKTQAVIRVLDALGRPCMELFNGELQAGKNQYFFDAARLTSGVYFIECQTGSWVRTQKVVVR